ncbi:MAG: hypothetical protein U0165_05930 [Polyangiaceae bacterium]
MSEHEDIKTGADPRTRFDRFVFTDRSIQGAHVELGYRLEGVGGTVDFRERIELPVDASGLEKHPAIEAALDGLHVVGGVSYWKAACPRSVAPVASMRAEDVDYWNELYTFGLGEYFFRNGLSPRGRFDFVSAGSSQSLVAAPKQAHGPLVLVGGGKDSAVSTEVVREAGVAATLFSVGAPPWIRSAAKAAEMPHLVARRTIDPALFELNRAGAYNGHIPISAYIAHLSLLVALIGGYDEVITSNERSASFGNVVLDGIEINHQWSKSLRFEQLFQSWVERKISGAPKYFSLLRPLSELRIARAFASHERYFDAVTSCNANFKVDGLGAPQRWCGHCPKCVFVATILSAVLTREQMNRVFETEVLGREDVVPMLEELLGLRAHKPFECVGTPDETLAALVLAYRAHQQDETAAMKFFVSRVLPSIDHPDALVREALSISDEHAMPAHWKKALDAYLVHR